ncbi:hypothetical protein [Gordonia sp. NPDC003422]
METRRLPHGLVALIYLRDERTDLDPETRERLDHITTAALSEAEYLARCEQTGRQS